MKKRALTKLVATAELVHCRRTFSLVLDLDFFFLLDACCLLPDFLYFLLEDSLAVFSVELFVRSPSLGNRCEKAAPDSLPLHQAIEILDIQRCPVENSLSKERQQHLRL